MRLSSKAMALTCGLLWGGCMLAVGLIHWGDASYGADFLRIMSSVYPGYHASATLGSVAIGTLYGLLDGAFGGFLFSSIYDWALSAARHSPQHSS
jgi:hypothetical protein